MNEKLMERDNPLDTFAPKPEGDGMSLVPSSGPQGYATLLAPRYGAQQVAVRRNKADVFAELKVLAAAAGEAWYWRWQVNQKDPETGKYVKVWIDGPSIKCANNVAREYGNCYVGARLEVDTGTHWRLVGLFMDFETGFAMERPFNQRKGQKAMGGDAARAEDMIYQVGVSKAIRNVVNNALETFTNFAKEEAKASIIEKVGRKLEFYKERVVARLGELKVELKRVELVRGRPFKDWLAADVTYTIAELQAIGDGMATVDESYPPLDKPEGQEKVPAANLDTFANANGAEQQQRSEPASQANAPTTGKPAVGEAAPPGSESPKASQQAGAADAGGNKPKGATRKEAEPAREPTSDAEYSAYANAWIGQQTDAAATEERWKTEKALRRKCVITQETFEELETALKGKVAELRGGK